MQRQLPTTRKSKNIEMRCKIDIKITDTFCQQIFIEKKWVVKFATSLILYLKILYLLFILYRFEITFKGPSFQMTFVSWKKKNIVNKLWISENVIRCKSLKHYRWCTTNPKICYLSLIFLRFSFQNSTALLTRWQWSAIFGVVKKSDSGSHFP